jgi:hypothetical protein
VTKGKAGYGGIQNVFYTKKGGASMSRVEKVGKKVKGVVTKEVWKKLKVISVMQEISITELVTKVLEVYVSKKKFEGEEGAA